MKHLEKISRPKQKKPTYSPWGQIGKIITLSLIGTGVYLLISRQKAFAEEIPEEYTPSEKPQDQLTKELYEQLPPSTIIEEATEGANIKIQEIKEEASKTIEEIRKKADEELATLKRQIETAYQLKQEDLIQEYRARDEIVRAEAEEKIRIAQEEATKQVQVTREEADQKVQAARIEIYLTKKSLWEQQITSKESELNSINAKIKREEDRRNSACEVIIVGTVGTGWGIPTCETAYPGSFAQRTYSPGPWMPITECARIKDKTICDEAKYAISILELDKNRVSAEINELKTRLKELG